MFFGLFYLMTFAAVWVVGTLLIYRHEADDDLVSAVMMGLLAAMIWPLSLTGLGVATLVRKLSTEIDKTDGSQS